MMIPEMMATKTRTGRMKEIRRAAIIKTKTRTRRMTKIRTVSP